MEGNFAENTIFIANHLIELRFSLSLKNNLVHFIFGREVV